MKKLFRSPGKLYHLENAEGNPVSEVFAEIAHPVLVDVKYELRPSPHQPIVVDIYGCKLMNFGQTKECLVLDNGVVLTGRTWGGGVVGGTEDQIKKMNMFDVEEQFIQLHPRNFYSTSQEIDAAVFAVVSSWPLGHGSRSNGWACPREPFSFTENLPNGRRKKYSSHALQIHHNGLEITLVETSDYWRRFVDSKTLQHDSIVGIRKHNGGVMDWKQVDDITNILSNFLGWVNHCVSPIFHVKGYRKGKLVYNGYNLHPHSTVHRDKFSWLPMFDITSDQGVMEHNADLVQDALEGFANTWLKNEKEKGVFHIALQLLRSKEKEAPASLLYLRDAFCACGILTSALKGYPDTGFHRPDIILGCLREIDVEDELPLKDCRDFIIQHHPELWWGLSQQKVLVEKKGNISHSLSNVMNWILHMDNPKNAERLLNLPKSVQQYLVEVAIWLSDLMILKLIGYRGCYFNRLTAKTENVPWNM